MVRADAAKRNAAFTRLQGIVTGAGGQCVKQAALTDIDYHGVLIELPAAAVRQTVDAINAGNDTQLLRLTDVKYFAPMGQASITPIDDGVVVIRRTDPPYQRSGGGDPRRSSAHEPCGVAGPLDRGRSRQFRGGVSSR